MAQTSLSDELVARVAQLARLELTDEERTRLAPQLSRVLDYVRVLNEVDTDSVEPMAHAVDQQNVVRQDSATTSVARSEALSNAPKSDGRFFLVPPILDVS